MAKGTFAKHVGPPRLGAGEKGEGILAVTKALMQYGIGYLAGSQGALSRLMDVLAEARVWRAREWLRLGIIGCRRRRGRLNVAIAARPAESSCKTKGARVRA
jgi:hypothetical protein